MNNKIEIIAKVVNAPLEPHAKAVTKNKWLNPTDSFGKMEEGVVSDSKTHKSDIIEGEIDQEIIIITI
jgi:hypothetical protein